MIAHIQDKETLLELVKITSDLLTVHSDKNANEEKLRNAQTKGLKKELQERKETQNVIGEQAFNKLGVRKILWVDDNPSNNVFERYFMEKWGVSFDLAKKYGRRFIVFE